MRIWLWGGFSVAVVLALAAAQVRQGMAGPMYRPGDARAVLKADEALGADPADAQRWRVAPDVTLYHFEEGQGREALVVHGGPGFPPSQPWRAGALLSDRYRLVYYHQRGCGRSSRPISSFAGANMYENMQALYRKLGLAEQVADIERIRRILGREKLILMGHSFGADLAAD
jgi:proline iminopeptidase